MHAAASWRVEGATALCDEPWRIKMAAVGEPAAARWVGFCERLFDAFSGSLAVTGGEFGTLDFKVSAVGALVPGKLRAKVAWYLEHPDERRAIAERGRARVLRDHRLSARVDALLRAAESVGYAPPATS